MKTMNNINNFGNINNGNNGNDGNDGNCVMNTGNSYRHFTLTENAVKSIEGLREFEEDHNHESFFFNLLETLSCLMDGEGAEFDREFVRIFNELSYYSGVLTEIVRTRP